MDRSQELRIVLEAIREQRIDAGRAADLARDWSPSEYPSFLDFLAARGALPTDPATDRHEVATLTAAGTVDPDETISEVGTVDPDETISEVGGPTTPGGRSSGNRLGRYLPIRLHRSGGLGQVWLARDTVLGREVALKMIRPDRVGIDGYLSRFLREARVTARLEHPAIVPLYDLIEDDDPSGAGASYAMRFVSGSTLAEAIEEYHARRGEGKAGPLDLRGLLDAFLAVCQAVAFAHARGVLHRDLKGQNVVLGDFGEVFLLDWGLTKGTEVDRSTATATAAALAVDEPGEETAPGGVVGTPAYMAPEVADKGPATRASDVYGLGAILYSILTGRAPAEGPTPGAILARVRSDDPRPPRSINPSTSPALEAVCRKAMARDPAARYATAEELASDVRRWLADEPVSAYRDPWPTRAGRWARRHRTVVAGVAVMLVTAVVALSIGDALLWRERNRTLAEWRRAEENLDAAHDLTIGLIQVTEKILPPVRGSELARRDLTRAAAKTFRRFAEQRPDSAEVRRWDAQLRRYEANLHRLLDETTEADSAYQAALAPLRADPRNADRRAETLRDQAGLRARTGRLKEALTGYDEALVLVGRLRAADPSRPAYRRLEASILVDRSAIETSLGRPGAAVGSADRAIEILGGLIERDPDATNAYDPLLLAGALTARAVGERESVGPVAALPTITDARHRLKALVEGRAFGGNLDDALFLQALIEYEASRTWLRDTRQDLSSTAETNLEAVTVRLADLARRHPEIPLYRGWLARARLALGEVRASRGRTADARKTFEEARDALERLTAAHASIPDHRADLGKVRLRLARIAEAEGRPDLAESLRKQGLADLQAASLAAPDDVEIGRSLAEARAAVPR